MIVCIFKRFPKHGGVALRHVHAHHLCLDRHRRVNRDGSDLYDLYAGCLAHRHAARTVSLLVSQQPALPVESLLADLTLKRLLVAVTVRVVQQSAPRVEPTADELSVHTRRSFISSSTSILHWTYRIFLAANLRH